MENLSNAPIVFAPCDVGIVCALKMELSYFQDRLSDKQILQGNGFTACIGKLGEKMICVAHGGVGQAAAARATKALIMGHRPNWIISAGYAGGLQRDVARHDLIFANAITNSADECLTIDVHGAPPANSQVHIGTLLTVDKIIHKPAEKMALGQRTGALAVEMETWAVAKYCADEQQKFLSVRVITDPVDEELPQDVAKIAELDTTGKRIGRALGNIIRRPSSVKDLWRLKENAIVASDRLAQFLATLIGQLP